MANRGSSAILVGIVVLLALAGIAYFAWLIPKRRAERRVQNERSAAAFLKTICSAQWEYRANDRDRNGIDDFWTGDVAGLFRLGLIQREVADADANPLFPLLTGPISFHGYYVAALQFDDSVTPPEDYRQDTDKKSGKVHHPEK